MSKAQAELLNLELAWKRVKLDIPHHVFIKNPFEVQLIEDDLSGYLGDLSARIRNDEYHPKPTYICNVPKGDGLVRPGSILSVDDRIVFYACVGAMPNIYEALWSHGIVDFSYEISNEFENANKIIGWDFRKESTKNRGMHVITTASPTTMRTNIATLKMGR